MISLDNLSYSYTGSRLAISDITAQIGPGIHLLLGENGAGKTTLLSILAGLRIPAMADMCRIDGVSPSQRHPSLMNRIFFVSDNMRFPYDTINQMVHRHAVFYPSFDNEMLRRNLEAFGMNGDERIDAFSLGNRKKAILAYAFALRPEVLLLDEPANGLDISAKQHILEIMAECVDDSQTVILSTHTVADFQQLFDSVIVMSAGHIILNSKVWEITERVTFVTDKMPPLEAIYIEQALGLFRAIVPKNPADEATDVDFVLLFKALNNSTSRPRLLELLTAPAN